MHTLLNTAPDSIVTQWMLSLLPSSLMKPCSTQPASVLCTWQSLAGIYCSPTPVSPCLPPAFPIATLRGCDKRPKWTGSIALPRLQPMRGPARCPWWHGNYHKRGWSQAAHAFKGVLCSCVQSLSSEFPIFTSSFIWFLGYQIMRPTWASPENLTCLREICKTYTLVYTDASS